MLSADALAAVGSAFSLMTFLTSILLGLAIGSGTVFSIRFGQKDEQGLKGGILASFVLLAGMTVLLNVLIYVGMDFILWFLAGMAAIFLYNFFASLLRSLGDSVIPLVFLGVSAFLNLGLDCSLRLY